MLRVLHALVTWTRRTIGRLGLRLVDFAREPGGTISPGWAVVAGVNRYDPPFGSLKQCVSDAISFYILLTDPDYGGFDQNRVALLVDGTAADITNAALTVVRTLEDAGITPRTKIIQEIAEKAQSPSRDQLLSEIGRIAKFSDRQELMMMYFAGHGIVTPERIPVLGIPVYRSYLVPRTAHHSDLEDTAVPLSRILKLMRTSRAAQKLLILDACYPVLERATGKSSVHRPVGVLAGSRELQPVVEGVFTFHLIEAMAQRIETENNDCVTLRDAYRHLRRRVPETIFKELHRYPSQLPLLRASRPQELILSGKRSGLQLPSRLSRRAAIAASLLLIGVAVGGAILERERKTSASKEVRIAVLPIRSLDGSTLSKDLAFSIGDYVTARLSTWDQVRLPSGAAVRAAESLPLQELYATLGVQFVLRGELRTQDEHVRIVLNLEDVSQSQAPWSKAFDGVKGRLLDLEDDICVELIKPLRLTGYHTPGREMRARTLEVSDLFMKGKRLSQESPTRETLEEAVTALRQAIVLDPNFVLSYAQLSRTYWQLYGRTKDPTFLDDAERMATQAVSSPQDFLEARLARADVFTARGQPENASKELRQALALAPNSDEVARALGRSYLQAGNREPAIEAFRNAVRINPGYWNNHFQLGNGLVDDERNRDGLCAYTKAVELGPDQPDGYEGQSVAYLKLGDFASCIKASDRALKRRRRPEVLSNKGTSYFYLTQYDAARASFEEAFELKPNDELLLGNAADSYRALGRLDEANSRYEQAIRLANTELRSNPSSAKALGSKALYLARTNHLEQAKRIIGEALDLKKESPSLLYNRALIFAIAHQNGEALRALEMALKYGMQTSMARSEPDFKDLRQDPQFTALMTRYYKPAQTTACQ